MAIYFPSWLTLRRYILLVTTGILIFSIGFGFINQLFTKRQTLSKNWLIVTPFPLTITLGLSGYIDSADRQTLYAPFLGVVNEVRYHPGDFVKTGQTILVLNTTEIDIELRQADAELLKAKGEANRLKGWSVGADMQRSRRTLSSVKGNLADTNNKLAESQALYSKGIVARQEVDALVRQQVAQRADLKSAEEELKTTFEQGTGINLDIAMLQLTNAQQRYDQLSLLHQQNKIVAPFSGNIFLPQISEGNKAVIIQPGVKVSPDTPLYDIARRDKLIVVAAVNEADINQLFEGQHVEVTGDAFNSIKLTGEIRSVGINPQGKSDAGESGTYEVISELMPLQANQQQFLRPGMSARLSVITYQTPRAQLVPPEALQLEGDKIFVIWRYLGNEEAHKQQITVVHTAPAGMEVSGLPDTAIEVQLPTDLKVFTD